MKKTIAVSLWLGQVTSEEELDDYVEISYSEDGRDISSAFLREFSIDQDDFDEDFFECAFRTNNSCFLSELLNGCSYEEEVIPCFEQKIGGKLNMEYNAVILMYEYDYPVLSTPENSKFTFTGTINIVISV